MENTDLKTFSKKRGRGLIIHSHTILDLPATSTCDKVFQIGVCTLFTGGVPENVDEESRGYGVQCEYNGGD